MDKRFTKSIFSICTAIFLTLFVTACGSSSSSSSPTTAAGYSISGTVSGTVTGNVTLTLTGGTDIITDTTDSTGAYSITGVANGTYTLYAAVAGNVFSPASKSVTVNGANLTGYDFISSAAGAQTFSGANTISANATYSSITIASGATLTATTGKSLTMTVNGIETPISSGTYTGTVVLTLTTTVSATTQSGPFTGIDTVYRTAVYVNISGAYDSAYSVAAAVPEGTVYANHADNVHVTSVGPNFSAFIITGGTYTINNPVIRLTGNALNDFVGHGFAIKSAGSSTTYINNADILNKGVVRGAIWVGDTSTAHIDKSNIVVQNGTLPGTIAGMWAPPWPLGVMGNCRGTLVVSTAKAYYTNSTITAQGWGTLSTDSGSGSLNATNCIVNATDSGYGAYCDGFMDTFDNCIFNVADYALIQTGGTATFSNGCTINSGRLGVMMHASSGTLAIEELTFITDEAILQMKSSSPTINVTNSAFTSGNGVILMYSYNDDTSKIGSGTNSTATFTDCNSAGSSALKGDIFNANTGSLNATIHLVNSELTGAITTAVWTPEMTPAELIAVQATMTVNPPAFDPAGAAYAYEFGEGSVTYEDTSTLTAIKDYSNKALSTGTIKVTLDSTSTWTVKSQISSAYLDSGASTTTCYINSLVLAAGARLQAPAGYTLTATDDSGTITSDVTGGLVPFTSTGTVILTLTAI